MLCPSIPPSTRRTSFRALASCATLAFAGAPLLAQLEIRWIWFDLYGTSSNEHFSEAMAEIGDWNRDGRGDLLVGAPDRGGVGAVAVVSGANGAELWTMSGTTAGGAFGKSLATVADLDSDGVRDWLIGAPFANTGGELTVVSGANGALIQTISSPLFGVRFGYAVADLGDLDADGAGDFAVGSPFTGYQSFRYRGVVEVFSGRTRAVLRTYFPPGNPANDTFGFALAGGCDVDADGTNDLIVGAPSEIQNPILSGYVAVYSGAVYSGISQAPIVTYPGVNTGGFFGCAVAGLRDVNNDGFGDVVVGARAAGAQPTLNYGQSFVFSGLSTTPLGPYTSNGAPNERYGVSTANLGDIDGDSVPDYGVGASVIGSYALSFVRVFSGASGGAILRFGGYQNAFGQSVAGAGDIDGDGYRDIAVGAPTADQSTTIVQCGRIAVFSLQGEFGVGWRGRPCGSALVPTLYSTGGPPSALTGTPNFALEVRYAPPLAPMVMWIGRSNWQWQPLDLSTLGFTGCRVYVPLPFDVELPLAANAAGVARLPLPIPRWAFLRGASIDFEAVVIDPSSPFLLDFTRAANVYIR